MRRLGDEVVHQRLEPGEAAGGEGVEQGFLVREVAIERADGDAGLGRDPGRGDAVRAIAGQQAIGGVDCLADLRLAARLLRGGAQA